MIKTLLMLILGLTMTACAARQEPNTDANHVATEESQKTEEVPKASVGKKILLVFAAILGGAGQGLQEGNRNRQTYNCKHTYFNNYECEKD